MRRTKEEAEATRQDVLKSALKVFSEKGYAAATLQGIAKRAGVTRGAIYWHFKNKADLYNSLLSDVSAMSAQIVVQAVEAGGTLPEILKRVFVQLLTEVERDPELRAVLELELFNTGRVPELEASRRQQVEAGQQMLRGIAQAMEAGVLAGFLRQDLEPITMARSFIAFQNGVIRQWLGNPQSFSLVGEAEGMAEIYLKGVLNVD